MHITKKIIDELTYSIIGCAIEVHRVLGPGLLESIYEKCLLYELQKKGLHYSAQKKVPLSYKELYLDAELRYDVLIEDQIITELKSCEGILPVHEAVVLSYMRLLEKPKGIIINFNCTNIFREGQKTLVNRFYGCLQDE